MDTIIILAVILEMFWIIGLVLCFKDDIYWENWGTFTFLMSVTNILTIVIYFKYF